MQKKVLHVIQALLKLPLVFTTQTKLKFKFNTVQVSDTCVVLFLLRANTVIQEEHH